MRAVSRLSDLGGGVFGEGADTFDNTLSAVIQNDPQMRDLVFKTQVIKELRILLAYCDEDIEHASRVTLGINPIVESEEPFDWGYFQSLRTFWSAVLHAFENDPEVQDSTEDIMPALLCGCSRRPPLLFPP